MNLREAIAALLESGVTTQIELAEKAGVPQNSISRFVGGKSDIRLETATKLLAAISAGGFRGRKPYGSGRRA